MLMDRKSSMVLAVLGAALFAIGRGSSPELVAAEKPKTAPETKLPTIAADGFRQEIQHETMLATVRVLSRKEMGVGVIIDVQGPIAYVLTAAHLVKGMDEVDVHIFSKESYPRYSKILKKQQIAGRGEPDLALIRIVGYEGESKGLKLAALKGVDKLGPTKLRGIATGCTKELAPALRLVDVDAVVNVQKPGEDKIGKYFQSPEASLGGQSGGPLVNSNGQLLGICSGAGVQKAGMAAKGYYVHLQEIRSFLENTGLGTLIK